MDHLSRHVPYEILDYLIIGERIKLGIPVSQEQDYQGQGTTRQVQEQE